jgi:sodium/potassium-transporting ATPase subunit alpha
VVLSAKCTDRNHFETRNLAFLGTLLTEGTCKGLVVATGRATIMGDISALATKDKRSVTTLQVEIMHSSRSSRFSGDKRSVTTLQVEITHFVKIIAFLAIGTGAASFTYWALHLQKQHRGFIDLPTILVTLISLIVGFVPLGLPVSVTLTLSLIALVMAKEAVLVKKLGM